MKHLLVIATLCMLFVGVGGVASLALTTPVVGPTHGIGTHQTPTYDLWAKLQSTGKYEKVGHIRFSVPARSYDAVTELGPHPGSWQIYGIDLDPLTPPFLMITKFGGCAGPEHGNTEWHGDLTAQNIQWLSKYQNSAKYYIDPSC